MSSEDIWVKVKEHFLKMSDVQKQGESLKTKRKMFVMLSKDNYVVKLPKERVAELLNSGEGQPYDPGNGKIMKEWVIIPLELSDKWIAYASEAKKFAKKPEERRNPHVILAIEYLGNALAYNQEHAQALIELGHAHIKVGNKAQALEAFRKAVDIDPKLRETLKKEGIFI